MEDFYLGKIAKSSKQFLYPSKDFTTHAVCVGMTGSGKTGLGITIIEEAALNKIPSIVIDPKGDLSNLLLTFPHLSKEEFLPWIDKGEAERAGLKPEEYAEQEAKKWEKGLADWQEGKERIQKLKDSVEMAIYTPGSSVGRPLSIINSLNAPANREDVRDAVLSVTSSLLGLLGINADPVKSREQILISNILTNAWSQGKDLSIEELINQVQKPAFNKIGALDLDTFYPAKERKALAITVNNLLASPSFHVWMEGEPLDIQKLLYNGEKPKVSILSIAHLNDNERMFFVTLFLNAFLGWTRRQAGTSNLRALLYMDEVAGYFPPIAAPPSKLPMITLLKQARAFGVGIVLATQNPVDLDYKGLSNCGTWFIGKLQTERDKARVIEGLRTASNGELDAKELDTLLATIPGRTFVLRSIYEKNPLLFQTRWALSYLRGPLTLQEIATLTVKPKIAPQAEPPKGKPLAPMDFPEYYIKREEASLPIRYKPFALGLAKVHFVDPKNKVDTWQEVCYMKSLDTNSWDKAILVPDAKSVLTQEPLPDSTFEELPSGLSQTLTQLKKTFPDFLYQNEKYQAQIEKQTGSQDKNAAKLASLQEKLRRTQEKLAQKQREVGEQKTNTFISIGTTILGSLLGRGVTKGTISNAGTSLSKAERISKKSSEAAAIEQECQSIQQEIQALQGPLHFQNTQSQTVELSPRKTDITIEILALAWIPL